MGLQKTSWFVTECLSEDYESLASLYQSIAKLVVNRAFFNWSYETALSEFKEGQSLIIKDQSINQVVSFVTFRNYPDRVEISAVGTNPKYLNQGLAGQLLVELKKNAAQRGLAIWLEVHENNISATKLYLKNGFKVLNTRKSYYSDGGNALVMKFGVD